MRTTVRFELCAAPGPEGARARIDDVTRERLVAELFELGTLGMEEREDRLLAYFAGDVDPGALRALAAPGIRIEGPLSVPDQDWERSWRAGLAPRRVGALWIRPSWCASRGVPELVIDPERAFGSGEHATTRLALAALLEELRPGDRVLDLGTGTGILGLGALASGARTALGLDVDPIACRAARANARANALDLRVVCGALDTLSPHARFEVVVANVLLERLWPWLPGLALRASRALIVAGPLLEQRGAVLEALASTGLRLRDERSEAQTGERWLVCSFS